MRQERTSDLLPLELNSDNPGWQDLSSCIDQDPDLFFPERLDATSEAKRICGSCAVREECLEYALANGQKFGVWGGLSERERRRLRRERAAGRSALINSPD